jgi:hypothetical protein
MRGPSIFVGFLAAVLLASCGSSSPSGGGAAGTGGGSAGGGGGAGASGADGGGAGSDGGSRPCLDVPCAGACRGDSCGGDWTCDTGVACTALAVAYCGCDGRTFSGTSCAPRAYLYIGTCESGVSCDTSKVLCRVAPPTCPAGQVPSVTGSCFGPCVPIESCTCTASQSCPSVGGGTTTCDAQTQKCTRSVM